VFFLSNHRNVISFVPSLKGSEKFNISKTLDLTMKAVKCRATHDNTYFSFIIVKLSAISKKLSVSVIELAVNYC